eukprot:m.369732 g.369732  ORF g.369732 m.369732 type:complete len:52 (-) comp50993_c0_seq1:63-218(-)
MNVCRLLNLMEWNGMCVKFDNTSTQKTFCDLSQLLIIPVCALTITDLYSKY